MGNITLVDKAHKARVAPMTMVLMHVSIDGRDPAIYTYIYVYNYIYTDYNVSGQL